MNMRKRKLKRKFPTFGEANLGIGESFTVSGKIMHMCRFELMLKAPVIKRKK